MESNSTPIDTRAYTEPTTPFQKAIDRKESLLLSFFSLHIIDKPPSQITGILKEQGRKQPKLESQDSTWENQDSLTLLHFAAYSSDFKALVYLLDNGAKVSARDKRGMTPLHYASMQGSLGMLTFQTSST